MRSVGEGMAGTLVFERVPERWGRNLALVVIGVALLWFGIQALAILRNPAIIVGNDYALYMRATHEFLAGHGFYPAYELAGPFTTDAQPILYPPQMLALFVPFTFLPAVLWFVIPPVVTAWIVLWHRPALWAWAAIAALLALDTWSLAIYLFGNPTTWLVMALALGTRWPALSALVLVKPTLAPFALLGVRNRWWWLVLGLGLVSAIVLAPLTVQWLTATRNLAGIGPLNYSLENVPVMLVPFIAWLGRQASRSSASSTLTTSLRPSASALR